MNLSDFDYDLPKHLIAQTPAQQRDASRLMVLDRRRKTIYHTRFSDIISFIRSGDLLVANDTRVIPARLYGKKKTGGWIEVFLLGVVGTQAGMPVWECLVKSRRPVTIPATITFTDELFGLLLERTGNNTWIIQLHCAGDIHQALERAGRTPLPPYIRRSREGTDDANDRARYQTVYARTSGSVAGPTAGFHFTPELMDTISAQGARFAFVTLHVGYGTFQPIRTETVEAHTMHAEYYQVCAETAKQVTQALAEKRRVIAVGTTATRVLETCTTPEGIMSPGEGLTDLYIYPGYTFKAVSALITNFHLPRSSLLLLVAAFAGRDFILQAYAEAVKEQYRFYSYGDAMLIL
ncbi:MAG: tRNA preQ1(34) S-adenosylmethionine ribosyltransferase-isomerase QueA [Desulfobacterota bacterium]|nr:tRNA preQ1(34) S-adenosylmethionine ribosyltransferase-isomerase QueA [Thermodesulfobacteriota bacterium]